MKLAEKSLIFPLDGRITKSCHASTICTAQNGDILAAWFGGEYEKANDVEIYLSRRSRTSGTWSTPVMVSQKVLQKRRDNTGMENARYIFV